MQLSIEEKLELCEIERGKVNMLSVLGVAALSAAFPFLVVCEEGSASWTSFMVC